MLRLDEKGRYGLINDRDTLDENNTIPLDREQCTLKYNKLLRLT